MNTNKLTTVIDTKVKLSLLWIFVVLLMVYADIISLMDPTSAIRERMVGTPMSAGFLFAGAMVMVISVVVSVPVWTVIRKNLVAGEQWAFWLLLCVIGFIEVMAFIASGGVGHARWQVHVGQSVLYGVGIGLVGYSILTQQGGRR